MTAVTEVWDAAQLMGLPPGDKVEMPLAPSSEATSPKTGRRKSHTSANKAKGKGVAEDPTMWGLPGHLTRDETAVYFKFRDDVEKRGGDFRDTVYNFGEEEGEVWTLCRWLRARKFVYDDVIKMVEEATETRKDAKKHDFYPNPVEALGVDSSLFFAQYPQLYTGFAKNGVPLFISKPGVLNVDGIECLTSLDGIIKFHWHVMMHDFADRLRSQKKLDPENFKRFECLCVLDLHGLTTSQLSNRALAITKEQSAIDSVCFPETMNKMLIVNAPTYFSATWRLIRGWLDPRTANKIEVISSRATAEKRLLELVDAEQLPSDYGGTGPDTNVTIMENLKGDAIQMDTKMLYVRGHATETVEVRAQESLDVEVHTRSTAGAKFTITDADTKELVVGLMEVKHTGTGDDTELPTAVKLTPEKHIDGPVNLKIRADSHAGRFSRQNYLLIFSHYKKK